MAKNKKRKGKPKFRNGATAPVDRWVLSLEQLPGKRYVLPPQPGSPPRSRAECLIHNATGHLHGIESRVGGWDLETISEAVSKSTLAKWRQQPHFREHNNA